MVATSTGVKSPGRGRRRVAVALLAITSVVALAVPAAASEVKSSDARARVCEGARSHCVSVSVAPAHGQLRYKRNCGYVSCTIYFTKSETKSISRGGSVPIAIIGAALGGPIGAGAAAAAVALADEAMSRGYCLKLKAGIGYSTPATPYVPQLYNSRSDGCV